MEMAVKSVPCWDPLVKLTHWGIVGAIIGNALFTGEGSALHIWVGYIMASLLALRLLWGFIGPAEARFSAFPPSPRRALAHIGDIAAGRHAARRSHNPLGALMVYAIWSCLTLIVASGIAMAGPPPASIPAPLSPKGNLVSRAASPSTDDAIVEEEERESGSEGDGEGMFEEIHEVAVNLLYLLILLHLAGVLFEARRGGVRVVRSMLPGGGRAA